MKIFTVGHSTHSFDELVAILKAHNVTRLVDIRTVPRSHHTPQFNEHSLRKTLPPQGISYKHIKNLGGLRSTNKGSVNKGWRNTSFRGYADYMQTNDFASGVEELLTLAADDSVAIMCAEAVPWRCHRSMVGDALLVRGVDVIDIFSETIAKPEKLTSFAKVHGTTLTYPEE